MNFVSEKDAEGSLYGLALATLEFMSPSAQKRFTKTEAKRKSSFLNGSKGP